MTISEIPGVEKLSKETLDLVRRSGEIKARVDDAGDLFTVWDAYRDRVAQEIRLNGSIKDVKEFDGLAQEYMTDYLKLSSKGKKFGKDVGMFKYKGYRAKYRESLLKYFEQVKAYKKSIKTTAKAVFKDPKGTAELDDIFAGKLKSAKVEFKFVKKLKKGEFGLPTGLKIAKGVGIACAVGLLAWGAVKAYKYIFKSPSKTSNNPDPTRTKPAEPEQTPVVQPLDTIKPADTVKEEIEQPAETTVVPVPEEVIEEPVVKEPVVEEPVVEEPAAEEQVVEETVVEEETTEEPVIEQKAEEKAPVQLPFILTFPAEAKPAEPVKEVYTPVAPFPYTMEYPSATETPEVKEETKPEEKKPVEETTTKPQAKTTDDKTKAEKLALFNESIKQLQATLSTEGIECDNYTVVKNDTLWKIAVKTLNNEGITSPDLQQIKQRIALIALLNEIEDVNKIYANQTFKIPSAALNAYLETNEEYSKILLEIAELFT